MSELTLVQLGISAEERSDLPAEQAELLAASLDLPFDPGAPLPIPWHWVYFNAVTATSGLGPDGHPRRESPLLVDFPRRMWVGGEIQVVQPLQPDTAAVRRTALASHARKVGSTGELLIVALEHTIEQGGSTRIVERQDVIYRPAGGVTPAPGPTVTLAPAAGWRELAHPTAPLLFRFSAVTFNSHRIHYDAHYATEVEGYPGLVVHGPLTAMLLAGSASRHLGRPLRSFSYRAGSPLFVDQVIAIDGVLDESGTAAVKALRIDGVAAMTATAG